jgi:hypothetical protein
MNLWFTTSVELDHIASWQSIYQATYLFPVTTLQKHPKTFLSHQATLPFQVENEPFVQFLICLSLCAYFIVSRHLYTFSAISSKYLPLKQMILFPLVLFYS